MESQDGFSAEVLIENTVFFKSNREDGKPCLGLGLPMNVGLAVCRAIHVRTFISQLLFSKTLSEYCSRPRDRRKPRPPALLGLNKSCRAPSNICSLNDTLYDKSNTFVLSVLFTVTTKNREYLNISGMFTVLRPSTYSIKPLRERELATTERYHKRYCFIVLF